MSVTDTDRETEELLQYLQGHIHQDKVHDAARRAMLSDATGGFFDEHLFRETLRASAKAFAAHHTRAHAEGYEAAVRDVVAWLRQEAESFVEGAKEVGDDPIWTAYHYVLSMANIIERGEFKP